MDFLSLEFPRTRRKSSAPQPVDATPSPRPIQAEYSTRAHSAPAARQPHRRRMEAQPHHRPDADRRTDRQRDEGVAPADGVDKIRKQMDRYQGQREAERRLQGEHRAD